MLAEQPLLAPAPVLVGHLAVFRRALVAIDGYTRIGDKEGMLLGGYLANALHNVPSMLWNCRADEWFSPEKMEEFLNEFPAFAEEKGAPERLVADCQRILSPEGAARELGLRDDLSDLDLAPLPKMRVYLDVLYWACLSMRLMRNHGHRPMPAFRDLPQVWTDRAEEQATFNGRVAAALEPVPSALVRWGNFDEARFRRHSFEDAVARRFLEEIGFLSSRDERPGVTT
jgi:hypothetical protein